MDKIEQLKTFLKMDENDGFTRFALAMEYRKTGDREASRAAFETLLKRDPDYVGAYYHLGKLLQEMDLEDEARGVYQTGIDCAQRLGDAHSASELRQAVSELDLGWND